MNTSGEAARRLARSRVEIHSRLHRSQISSRDAREKMAALSQNIARSRIPPATQASYFRYFTLRMCGALEPRCGALKPGALEPWGAQTAIRDIEFDPGSPSCACK